MGAWLALVVAMAAAGWFAGKGLHQSALAKQAAVDEQRPKRQQPKVKRIPYPKDSAEARWMEEVRQAGPGDYEKLCHRCFNIFTMGGNFDPSPTPDAPDAMRWVMGKWYLADREGFMEKAPDIDCDAVADVLLTFDLDLALDLMVIDPDLQMNPFDGVGERLPHAIALSMLQHRPDLLLQQDWHEQNLGDAMDAMAWNDAIEELAKKDVIKAAAIFKLAHCGRNERLANGLHRMLRHWDLNDPRRKQWLASLEDPRLKYMAYHAHWELVSQTDPQQAIDEMFKVELSYEDNWPVNVSKKVLRRYGKEHPLAAVKLLKQIEDHFVEHPDKSFDESSPEVKEWAAENPFSQLSDGHEPRDWVEDGQVRWELVDSMAKQLPDDPAELFKAIQQMTSDAAIGDAEWRQRLQGEFIIRKSQSWSIEECLRAGQQWQILLNEDGEDEVLRFLAYQSVERDPYKTLEMLDQLPEAKRGHFYREVMEELPDSNFELRAELLEKVPIEIWDSNLGWHLSSEPERFAATVVSRANEQSLEAMETLKAFSRGWVEDDPAAAAAWSLSLTDPNSMNVAIGGLVESWMRFDPDSTLGWADALPVGAARDAASQALVTALMDEDPEVAWHWVEAIADSGQREETYQQLAVNWEDAPEAFHLAHQRAREEAGLPPIEQEGGDR